MAKFGFGLGITSLKSKGAGGNSYTGPQIVIIGDGQSNWLRHASFGSSPPAASAGTFFFSGGVWGAVPAANGARELLNAIAAATGKTVGLISGGQSGVNIAALQPGAGTGYFESLAAQMVAADAGSAEENYILYLQGEGDADSVAPTSPAAFAAAMDSLHGSLVAVIGKTKTTCKFIVSSLAGWVGGAATDAAWEGINNSLYTAHDTYPNIIYSHSNRIYPVDGDGAHWNLASYYGKSGAQYARTILWLRGTVATRPLWNIASVAIVDATHTDVVLAHSMGTDFTPTSGITGFTLSIDGFSTTIVPSAAVRQDANTIRLTHSSLATSNSRTVRYQYGKLPVITAPVLDNSGLAAPLNHSAGQSFVAVGSAANPILVHRAANSDQVSGGGQNQGIDGLDLSISANTSFIVAVTSPYDGTGGSHVASLTITPAGGSAINGTLLYKPPTGTEPYVEFWKVDVPAATAGMNNAALRVNFGTFMFTLAGMSIASVNTGDVTSWTPVDTDTTTVSGTARTLDVSSSDGGFIYAVAQTVYNGGATTATWTGDEPPIEANDYTNSFGVNFSTAIANNCQAHANDNTITATYANGANMRLSAISIR